MAVVKKLKSKKVRTRTSRSEDEDSDDVFDRISDLGFDDDMGIKLMLYGRSGTGKTTLWSTFPGKTLAIICSGSDQPGELRSIDTAENRKRVKKVTLRKSSELGDLVRRLRKEPGLFNNVVLDHVSGFADLVLRSIVKGDDADDDDEDGEVVDKKFGAVTQQQYGEMTNEFKRLVRPMLGLPQNVIIIAQERTFGGTDGEEGVSEALAPTVGAALTPSLTGWMNSTVDYLAQTFLRQRVVVKTKKMKVGKKVKTVKTTKVTDDVEYCLRVGPNPTYHTKFRVPGGIRERVVIDPTYDKIMALIRGESAPDNTTDDGEE